MTFPLFGILLQINMQLFSHASYQSMCDCF